MARLRLAVLVCNVLLLATGPASAQSETGEFVPEVSYTPSDPDIGDQIMLRVSLTTPAELLVNFPRLGRKVGGFALTGQLAPAPEQNVKGEREWVQQYRLEPQTTGDLVIPPLTITIQDPKSLEAITVTAPETVIPIASIAPADADLREIRNVTGPVPLQQLAAPVNVWLIVGAMAVLVLAAAAVWPRRQQSETVPPPQIPPQETALAALAALRPMSEDSETSERFHVGLAAALRQYLQDGLAIAAPRRTTDELLGQSAAAESVPELGALAAGALAQCDKVKFARQRPTAEAKGAALRQAIEFVEITSLSVQAAATADRA